ncbi:PAP2 superfamily [Weissella viridescens]|uniref:PAP2 superfamily n=1 Tax=Weissella viridescens TaxID=1629 RepID=A0A380NY27_WEIVI|nr:PAP2 superfamily [Weissella viridescens]
MIAFALALIIYKKSQSVLVHDVTYVLAGLWVMTVAISRVFLRDHYPSDVLGSMLLACAVICFALGLFRQVMKIWGEQVKSIVGKRKWETFEMNTVSTVIDVFYILISI